MLRFNEKFKKQVIPALLEKFSYKSIMAVPKVTKTVINIGYGKEVAGKTGDEHKKIIESILNDLNLISGQKAVKTHAKKAISGFKIRKGSAVGAKVTLRGEKMADFLDRLIHLSLPRTRDFKGIPLKSIDDQGNLTIVVKEHIAFPEILPEKTRKILSLEVTVVTTAKTKQEAEELFKLLGFPIK
jgi:large subunit ribosomal protein L5